MPVVPTVLEVSALLRALFLALIDEPVDDLVERGVDGCGFGKQ